MATKKKAATADSSDSNADRYRFRGDDDAHEVSAIEATEDDVNAGRAGSVGDFIVTRDGYAVQWWSRDTFLDQYEPAD